MPATSAAFPPDNRRSSKSLEKDEDLQAIAASSLARIACAERDRPLAERVASRLVAAIPSLIDAAQRQSEWGSKNDVYQCIVESLLDLAQWPEMQVDVEPLRPILQSVASTSIGGHASGPANKPVDFRSDGPARSRLSELHYLGPMCLPANSRIRPSAKLDTPGAASTLVGTASRVRVHGSGAGKPQGRR
jgi:hypothetical protein